MLVFRGLCLLNFRREFGPIGIGSKVSTFHFEGSTHAVQNSGTPRLVVPRRPRVFFNVMFQVHVVSPMVSQPEKGYKEAKCHVCHVFFREKKKKPYYFPLYWLVYRDPYNGLL